MRAFKANWEVQGLTGVKVLAPGATVKLDEAEAEPLVKCGALSPCDEAAGLPLAGNQDLSTMNKAQLVEYAQGALNLSLDINNKKDELLAAIAAAASK